MICLFAITMLVSVVGIYLLSVRWLNIEFDVSDLEKALNSKDFQVANEETNKIMLNISRRNILMLAHIFPGLADIDSISCQSLAEVNTLWEENTDGYFGLAAQAQVWSEKTMAIDWVKYRTDPHSKDFEKGNLVFEEIVLASSTDFSPDQKNFGKLPVQTWLISGRLDGENPVTLTHLLFSRIKDCNLY
jgi:hypothetical protein